MPRSGDKFSYELAAYQLNRLLELDVIPVTAERVYQGRRGIIQLWIDNLTSSLALSSSQQSYNGECDAKAQENFINTFDYLIMNVDRNQSNILMSKDDWQIWFIDHSQSFLLKTRLQKFLRGSTIRPTDAFKYQLKRVTRSQLNSLSPWLTDSQIEQLWKRRNRLIESEYIQ